MPQAKESSGARNFAGRAAAASVAAMADDKKKKKKGPGLDQAWRESRELIAAHKSQLAIGLALMVVSRVAGLVLPFTSSTLIDDVVGKHQIEKLGPLALMAGGD